MTYHLQDIEKSHELNPRTFLRPSDIEIEQLKVGDLVRLFFVLEFQSEDNCRAERMWVEIKEIDSHNFSGYLTNQPRYIKEIQIGDIVKFKKNNIATVLTEPLFDETQKAIITQKALVNRRVDWVLRSEERHHETDSGWQLYFGDETQEYLDSEKPLLVPLSQVLSFEPRLEKVFSGSGNQYEWNEESCDYIKVIE